MTTHDYIDVLSFPILYDTFQQSYVTIIKPRNNCWTSRSKEMTDFTIDYN